MNILIEDKPKREQKVNFSQENKREKRIIKF